MREYVIKLRRYRRGGYGTTIYKFPVLVKAVCFAIGYQAALRDIGMTNIFVTVHDEKGAKVFDAESIHE